MRVCQIVLDPLVTNAWQPHPVLEHFRDTVELASHFHGYLTMNDLPTIAITAILYFLEGFRYLQLEHAPPFRVSKCAVVFDKVTDKPVLHQHRKVDLNREIFVNRQNMPLRTFQLLQWTVLIWSNRCLIIKSTQRSLLEIPCGSTNALRIPSLQIA